MIPVGASSHTVDQATRKFLLEGNSKVESTCVFYMVVEGEGPVWKTLIES